MTQLFVLIDAATGKKFVRWTILQEDEETIGDGMYELPKGKDFERHKYDDLTDGMVIEVRDEGSGVRPAENGRLLEGKAIGTCTGRTRRGCIVGSKPPPGGDFQPRVGLVGPHVGDVQRRGQRVVSPLNEPFRPVASLWQTGAGGASYIHTRSYAVIAPANLRLVRRLLFTQLSPMDLPNQNPEQKARDNIDKMLARRAGRFRTRRQSTSTPARALPCASIRPTSARPTTSCSWTRRPSASSRPSPKTGATRSPRSRSSPQATPPPSSNGSTTSEPLPFVYESTGVITRFTDGRDPKPRSREVFSFHRPETLAEWLTQSRNRCARGCRPFRRSIPAGLRDCQITAIENLEESSRTTARAPSSRWRPAPARPSPPSPRSIACSSTPTPSASCSWWIRGTSASRPSRNSCPTCPNDDNRKFTELYNVQRLKSSFIAKDSQVCISTIQRMYSILKDEPLDEAAEEDQPGRKLVQPKAAAARRLQPENPAGVLRLHHHRRMPPLHLQPLAAGARLLRRLPDRPHRHARQPHLRLLQQERRQRIQPRKGRRRWRQRRQRSLRHRHRRHPAGRARSRPSSRSKSANA